MASMVRVSISLIALTAAQVAFARPSFPIYNRAGLPKFDYTTLPLFLPEKFRSSQFYRMYFHWPILASRGCPHPCE